MSTPKASGTALIQSQLKERLETLRTELRQLEESKGSATKSSAGDKHETGRAMMERELVHIQGQIESARKQLNELGQMPKSAMSKVAWGSLVRTNRGVYLLSVPMGRVKGAEEPLFAISAASPLGQLLLGKEAGESVGFRGNNFEIIEVL